MQAQNPHRLEACSTRLAGAKVFLKFLKGRVRAQTDGGNMRIVLNIVGVLLVLLGSVWVLQGINVLPGSFMSGQMRWAVRGGILLVAGIVGLVWANRKQKSAA
jgi:hypothetical protein